ncbi:hypothetical protein IF2G_05850 [Cordyceps javanica]|nr:hypothetical protein IF2G_05850 [Cordyceps javanica]
MTEGLLEGRGEKKKGLQGLTIAGYGGRACRWLAGREDANEGRGWVGGKWIVPKTTELLARPALVGTERAKKCPNLVLCRTNNANVNFQSGNWKRYRRKKLGWQVGRLSGIMRYYWMLDIGQGGRGGGGSGGLTLTLD